jgi:hypothetical protein
MKNKSFNLKKSDHINDSAGRGLKTAALKLNILNKAKTVPLHAMKALGGRGAIAPTHSRLGTRWGEWSVSRRCRTLAPGKGPPAPIVQEAG